MSNASAPSGPARLLGIEGGATRTTAILATDTLRTLRTLETGPANVRLLSDRQLERLFRSLSVPAKGLTAVGIGLAGARTESDRARIRQIAKRLWPKAPCYATHDLETALAAAADDNDSELDQPSDLQTRVLVLCGTGSCCFGMTPEGRSLKVGGWGHLLGDRGSAYDLALDALRRVLHEWERRGRWPTLGARLLRKLQHNDPEQWVDWIGQATKPEIAALAVEVFAAWGQRDRLARALVQAAAGKLVQDATTCARRLSTRGDRVGFVLGGGVFQRQPGFVRLVKRQLRTHWPHARIILQAQSGAWGAVTLARRYLRSQTETPQKDPAPAEVSATDPNAFDDSFVSRLAGLPTEQRNPRSVNLHRLSLSRAMDLMLTEEAGVTRALRSEKRRMVRAIGWIARSQQRGGRLVYVGAGTSGRLGVLDASECPPTFRTSPEQVQGIMAGGRHALWESVEGAEDDRAGGVHAVAFRNVTSRDVVVGITASGRTPFVIGALAEAKRRGARSILLCFNPQLRLPAPQRPSLVIAPGLGPEVLTGSTRLKAGTATKLILNLFTTLAMVRLGKVHSNLMVDLDPSNTKLRDRAARIVHELTGINKAEAVECLESTGWQIKDAIALARRKRGRKP